MTSSLSSFPRKAFHIATLSVHLRIVDGVSTRAGVKLVTLAWDEGLSTPDPGPWEQQGASAGGDKPLDAHVRPTSQGELA